MKILTTTKDFNKSLSVVVTAAGSSTRIGGNTKKEYLPLKNGTVLSHSVSAFFSALKSYKIDNFIVTYPHSQLEEVQRAIFLDPDLKGREEDITFIEGNTTRQSSIYNALCQIKEKGGSDFVLVHDGARPFVSSELILRTLNAAFETGAAVPGLTPVDTQKEIDENGFIVRHLERKSLSAVQTPQVFSFNPLFTAHTKALSLDYEFTDDTELYGRFSGQVKVVEGDSRNVKLTYPKDLLLLSE